MAIELEYRFTSALGRDVCLRTGTSDQQTWNDTFGGAGGYHLPPVLAMPTPRTVLDLGANIGLTAAHYAALWPEAKVYAVEMDRESVQLIPLNAPSVKILARAVSHNGATGSYSSKLPYEARIFQSFGDADTPVLSMTLRRIIRHSFGLEGADFVKMDIEGTEWDLFHQPDWAPLVRHLLVELHPTDAMLDDTDWLVGQARNRLEEAGFHSMHHPPHPRAVWAWR